MITHAVFFKFRKEHADDVRAAKEGLDSLAGEVPEIRSLSVGINILPSQRAYDLCLIAQFESLDALAAYRAHPKHVEIADWIDQRCVSTVSVDYES